jgi:hypothetical protein
MDQRDTFQNLSQLHSIVSGLFTEKQKASLLIDSNGLTRVEGEITFIEQQGDPAKTVITIDNVDQINLSQIIAVNGLFRSDYSEC